MKKKTVPCFVAGKQKPYALVEEPVASTVVQVASLPKSEFLVEIEAIGVL